VAYILDPGEVLEVLGLTASDRAAGLALRVHRRVERLVRNYVGYDVTFGRHVDLLPGGQLPVGESLVEGYEGVSLPPLVSLQLTHLPVTAVASVRQDPEATWVSPVLLPANAYRLDVAEDGRCHSGLLVARDGWSWQPRTVRVEYDAGWTPTELEDEAGDFKLAVVQATQKFFNEQVAHQAARYTAGTGAVVDETTGSERLTYSRTAENYGMMHALPPGVMRLLEPRKRLGPYYG
jgi:hypothetical protein